MHIDIEKETLGKSLKVFDEDSPVFNETVCRTNSFSYSFKNDSIKITLKDSKKIDTITVFLKDQTFDFEKYANHFNLNS